MDWGNWDKRLASDLKSRSKAEGPLKLAKLVDPHTALHGAEIVTGLVAHHFGLDAQAFHAVGDAIRRSIETGLGHTQDAHSEPKAEQVKAEQAKAEQENTEQVKAAEQVEAEQVKTAEQVKAAELIKAELDKAAEQVKAGLIKADAERAAAVIEEQTAIVEQEIVDEPGKSTVERDALEKELGLEKQRRETMLDEMERNYFKKHPDLSKDEREGAEKTFKGIKDKEMENLSRERETRLGELTHAQDQRREEIAERLEELEGTRERS
jgi:hypothetical protein